MLALLGVFGMLFSKPHFFKPLIYNFNHWGLELEGEGYQASLPWRKISKAEERKDAFFLYELNIPSFNIAKKNFGGDGQLDAFRQLLREKISD